MSTLDDYINVSVREIEEKRAVLDIVVKCFKMLKTSFIEFVKAHEKHIGRELSRKLIKEIRKVEVRSLSELLGTALWSLATISNYFGVEVGVGIYTEPEEDIKCGAFPEWIDRKALAKYLRAVKMCMLLQAMPKAHILEKPP